MLLQEMIDYLSGLSNHTAFLLDTNNASCGGEKHITLEKFIIDLFQRTESAIFFVVSDS